MNAATITKKQELINENERLRRKSNGLLRKVQKMIREGNRNGASLVFSHVEDIKAQRQRNNHLIISLTEH